MAALVQIIVFFMIYNVYDLQSMFIILRTILFFN